MKQKSAKETVHVEPNLEFAAMIRDGEQGNLVHVLGHAWQRFMAEQVAIAQRAGGVAKGTFVLKWTAHTGPDGKSLVTMDPPKSMHPKEARPEFAIETDEDGEQTSKPAQEQLFQ